MRHYTLLLGAVAGLSLSTAAFATDLPDTAKAADNLKISGYYAAFNATGGYFAAFYYEPAKHRQHFYTAGIDLPPKHHFEYTIVDRVAIGTINGPPSGIALSKSSEGVWPGLAGLAQKLKSSADYRGTPAHGFYHVLGKIPAFATKMLA